MLNVDRNESRSSIENPTEPVTIASVATGRSDESDRPDESPSERHRAHDRDNPWFVPVAVSDAEVASSDSDDADSHNADDDDHDQSLAHPTEGSLLHRAFHGPSSTDDVDQEVSGSSGSSGSNGRAVLSAAPVDELSPRRRARSPSDDAEEEAVGGYHEFELPFPPHSPRAKKVAVS